MNQTVSYLSNVYTICLDGNKLIYAHSDMREDISMTEILIEK